MSAERRRILMLATLALAVFGVALASMPFFRSLDPSAHALAKNFFQIVCDGSTPKDTKFIADEGYAVYVNYQGKKFLMDTGARKQSLINNLKAAGILLDDLDFVFMTHWHRDHKGGLDYIQSTRPSLPIYIAHGGGFELYQPETLNEVKDHLKIGPNIFLLHLHSDTTNVSDVLALLIITKKGPYVFTANSHIGFDKIIEKAKRIAGQDVFLFSGGMRLRRAGTPEIQATIEKLKALGVTQVSPSHDSSKSSVQNVFKEILGSNYVASRLGQKVPLEPPS